MLARLLKDTQRRDLIVVSFKQEAVDRFHELVPADRRSRRASPGSPSWLRRRSPGAGVVAFQVPITYAFGAQLLAITTAENVARAHSEGYAWQNWFARRRPRRPGHLARLIDMCVDGTMTSHPRAYERCCAAQRRRAAGR